MEEEAKLGNSRFKRVCVFCGSSTGKRNCYQDAAVELGKELVARKVDLVYGGGSVGLMGLISEAVHSGGGHVLGFDHPKNTHVERDYRGDVRRGEAGGQHAPAQGRDGPPFRRLHRPPWWVRNAGGALGGHHLGAARHPQQARGVAQCRRLLQLALGLHRQSRGRRLHPALSAPPLRLRPERQRPRPKARGV